MLIDLSVLLLITCVCTCQTILTPIPHMELSTTKEWERVTGVMSDGKDQFIHCSYIEFMKEIENPKDARLEHYLHPLFDPPRKFTLNGLTKFDQVSQDSLENFIQSTMILCMVYRNVASGMYEIFDGIGVLVNYTHILTAGHNVYRCIIKTREKTAVQLSVFQACNADEFNSDSLDRFELESINIGTDSRRCVDIFKSKGK